MGFGGGIGRKAFLLQVPEDLFAAPPAAGEPPVRRQGLAIFRRPDGGEDFLLFRAQVVGVEGARLLHRGQREMLQQVVLDDVAGSNGAVVLTGTAARADVLGHRNLQVVRLFLRQACSKAVGVIDWWTR
jgi:hypothetical protein